MTMATKDKSQIFNWNRYMLVLRHDLRLNRKSILLRILLMLTATTTLMLFATWPSLTLTNDYAESQLIDMSFVLKFCGVIFCCLGASLFMENMTTAGKRLNTLMLPASLLEKFVARWTICILGVTVSFFVCFILGDLIRMLVIYCYYPDLEGLRFIGPWKVLALSEHWYLPLTAILSAQATYILGSTIWPKNSFPKTFGAMFVLLIILTITFTAVSTISIDTYQPKLHGVNPDFETIIGYIWLISTISSTIFCYVVAYFRTRESEIINRM